MEITLVRRKAFARLGFRVFEARPGRPVVAHGWLDYFQVRNLQGNSDMKWIAKITSGGRVTIPREVRKRLGVHGGDRLAFEVDQKGVRIFKARKP